MSKNVKRKVAPKRPPVTESQDDQAEAVLDQRWANDGVYPFTIKGGPHNGESAEFDLLLTRMAAEPIEAKYDVKKGFQPLANIPFVRDIHRALSDAGCVALVATGEPYCTPSMAVSVWVWSVTIGTELQKKSK